MGSDDISVYFTDGYVVARNYVLVAAKFNSLADEYFSRCFYFRDGVWKGGDITDSVHSVTYDPASETALWLGLAGKVTTTTLGRRATETLADVARLGNVNRIRNVAGDFYICGYGGQVYKRTNGSWVHYDAGLLVAKPDATSVDLMDIGGSSSDDLYVVGTGGAIWYQEGSGWVQLDCPTNVHLNSLKYVNRDEIYVCGNRGIVLRGNRLGWSLISHDSVTMDLYGIESFGGDIYVSGMDGLFRVVDSGLEAVNVLTGHDSALTFHRLHANDEVLWSFGTDHLAFFDGTAWHFVAHSDNK